jgi:methanogenic corrinoid protein MtbC1
VDQHISEAVADLREDEVLQSVRQILEAGGDPFQILESCRAGMNEVGRRFEVGEYWISDLVMAGMIFKQVAELLAPFLEGGGGPSRGMVVFGTVKSDIHDIGKDLVIASLRSAGFEVEDLGVDVPPERFVEAVQRTGATVVGLCGLLTVAFDAMGDTVAALERAGLRPGVRVMIGGGMVDEMTRQVTGADAWGKDPLEAVRLAERWLVGDGDDAA